MITCHVIDVSKIDFYHLDTLICSTTLVGAENTPAAIAKRMAIAFHFAQGKWAAMHASDGEAPEAKQLEVSDDQANTNINSAEPESPSGHAEA